MMDLGRYSEMVSDEMMVHWKETNFVLCLEIMSAQYLEKELDPCLEMVLILKLETRNIGTM